MSHTFSATIKKLGENPYVDVPLKVSRAFGETDEIPVTGTLNTHPLRATLVPHEEERHRLFLNGAIRHLAQVGVGDRVTLTISMDEQPRVPGMPPALVAGLLANPHAHLAWELLPEATSQKLLAYLNQLKSAGALQRECVKAVAVLQRTHSAPSVLWGVRLPMVDK